MEDKIYTLLSKANAERNMLLYALVEIYLYRAIDSQISITTKAVDRILLWLETEHKELFDIAFDVHDTIRRIYKNEQT